MQEQADLHRRISVLQEQLQIDSLPEVSRRANAKQVDSLIEEQKDVNDEIERINLLFYTTSDLRALKVDIDQKKDCFEMNVSTQHAEDNKICYHYQTNPYLF